eukprot:g6954.t1
MTFFKQAPPAISAARDELRSSEPHRTSTSSASGAAAPAGPATKAICIFDTGSEQKTCTFFKKPPGFAIRFPAMTVSKVTGALAMEMGIQAGWKLLEWGTAEDEMHSLGNGEEKGALRQSYVSMIQQLPREKDQEEGDPLRFSGPLKPCGGSPTVGKSLAASAVSIPGKWAYDLEVVVISAKGLRDADWMGSSDPYCVATVQGRGKTTFKTKVLKATKDPVWNEKSKVQDFHDGDAPSERVVRMGAAVGRDQIFFELFDQDGMGKHDKLGHAAVGWEELQDDSAPLKTTLVLDESGKKENNPATLDVKITVMKRKLEAKREDNNIYRVFVDIKCARGLRDADSFFGGGGSDPYCVCSVVGTGKSKFKTRSGAAAELAVGSCGRKGRHVISYRTIDNKTDPQWNESGVLPDFHKGDKLLLEVYDKDWSLAKHNHERPPSNRVGRAPTTMAHYRAVSWSCQDIGKKDDFLGKCEIAAAKALTGFKETEFKLTDTGMINKKPVEAFVTVAVQTHKRTLQGLAPFHGKQQVKPGSMKYQLEVQILAAEGLRNADWLSSGSDPYCLVTVKGKGTATVKTKTIKNEHSPLWKHTDTINDFYHGDALSIQVKDADRLKHDDLLGQVQLLTEQLIPDGFDGDLKLRNTGWKDPENHPVFDSRRVWHAGRAFGPSLNTWSIRVLSRQKAERQQVEAQKVELQQELASLVQTQRTVEATHAIQLDGLRERNELLTSENEDLKARLELCHVQERAPRPRRLPPVHVAAAPSGRAARCRGEPTHFSMWGDEAMDSQKPKVLPRPRRPVTPPRGPQGPQSPPRAPAPFPETRAKALTPPPKRPRVAVPEQIYAQGSLRAAWPSHAEALKLALQRFFHQIAMSISRFSLSEASGNK